MAEKYPGMLTLPPEEQTLLSAQLSEWKKVADKLAELSGKEMELRKSLVARWFKNAEEGTNTMPLSHGKALKASIKINRKVDAEVLDALKAKAILDGSNVIMNALQEIIVYKPSLVVKEWKALDDDIKILFADVVTESEGAPSLEIATPKR